MVSRCINCSVKIARRGASSKTYVFVSQSFNLLGVFIKLLANLKINVQVLRTVPGNCASCKLYPHCLLISPNLMLVAVVQTLDSKTADRSSLKSLQMLEIQSTLKYHSLNEKYTINKSLIFCSTMPKQFFYVSYPRREHPSLPIVC